MMKLIVGLWAALCCLSASAGSAPRTGPAPSWIRVLPLPLDRTSLDQQAEDGYVDLMVDRQVNVGARSLYYHTARRLLSASGVQNGSEVSVSYDPSFQQLVFHRIRLFRGGRELDRLDLRKLRVIDEEEDRASHLYNGNKTAILLLEDVQVGDVVDYSYTLQGFNPLFSLYSSFPALQYDVPVYTIYQSVVMPPGRSLRFRTENIELQPRQTNEPGGLRYEWERNDVRPISKADNLPSWFSPDPGLYVSEYQSWGEVVSELLPYYRLDGSLPATVVSKAEAIRKSNPGEEEQLLAAIRFVQDEIRYLGIEIGPNGHAPHAPAQVLAQRYGDCKDKSYLLCVLLRALNVEAMPMLVNTAYKRELFGWLPTPFAFDHCVVAVRWKGNWRYFDPTINFQRGPLNAISFPDYGAGLLLTPGSSELVRLPAQVTGSVECKQVIDASQADRVRLIATTLYTGTFADNIRGSFHSRSYGEITKQYQKFYADFFDEVEVDTVFATEVPETGAITVTERYRLPKFWKSENGKLVGSAQPYVMDDLFLRLKDKAPTMPFALRFPARYHEEVLVKLPDAIQLGAEDAKYEHPSFRFYSHYEQVDERTWRLVYDYEALKDHVAPKDAKAYFDLIDAIDDHWSFSFDKGNGALVKSEHQEMPRSALYLLGYVALGIAVLITVLVRRRR